MLQETKDSSRVGSGAATKLRDAAAVFRSTMIELPPVVPPAQVAPPPIAEKPAIEEARREDQSVKAEVPKRTEVSMPRALREKREIAARNDPEMKRATYWYYREQLVDLKKLRQRVLEITGDEIDESALAREAMDLLLRRYNTLLHGTTTEQASAK